MFAYIGISFLAVMMLIGCIRWGVGRAGYCFPRLFWVYCSVAVVLVSLLVPRMVLRSFGVGGTLLFCVFLLFLLALWISFSFAPERMLVRTEIVEPECMPALNEGLLMAVPDGVSLPVHELPALAMLEPIGPTDLAAVEEAPQPILSAVADEKDIEAAAEPPAAVFIFDAASLAVSEIGPDGLQLAEEPSFDLLAADLVTSVALAPDVMVQEREQALEAISASAEEPIAVEEVTAVEEPILAGPEETIEAALPAAHEQAGEAVTAGAPETEDVLNPEQEVEETVLPNAAVDRLPKSDELDDLLDFALVQRECRRFSAALAAIRAAVDLYGEKDPDSLPYLIIEWANIHKAQGQYDQAIYAFQQGQAMLADERFLSWREQFVVSIAYLRIVRNALISRQQKSVPLEEIPEQIKLEIEEAFAEWNRLS